MAIAQNGPAHLREAPMGKKTMTMTPTITGPGIPDDILIVGNPRLPFFFNAPDLASEVAELRKQLEAMTRRNEGIRKAFVETAMALDNADKKLVAAERDRDLLRAECAAARECWRITNGAYTVESEKVDALADARAATDSANAMGGA